jgi:hydroxyethylthiazole kinase
VDPAAVARDLEAVRSRAPLVHNITNFVVMEPTANALLALGASPVMAHALEEVADIAGIASALVLNIGTLSPAWIEAMILAGQTASRGGTPVVLDPVGAGASAYRTRSCMELIEAVSPSIIRGNASEILTLAGEQGGGRGVDSTARAEDAGAPAGVLARGTGSIISVSGALDLVTDGTRELRISSGTPLMARVTGMGCTASALTGALAAVNPDFLEAAAHAMAIMGVAGEMAAEIAKGPGSLVPAFHDALYRMDESDLRKRLGA